MNTYVSITITNYGMNSSLNHGLIYISVESCKLEMFHKVSMEEAVKEMANLAKKLRKAPKLINNPYNPEISYRELSGYLD